MFLFLEIFYWYILKKDKGYRQPLWNSCFYLMFRINISVNYQLHSFVNQKRLHLFNRIIINTQIGYFLSQFGSRDIVKCSFNIHQQCSSNESIFLNILNFLNKYCSRIYSWPIFSSFYLTFMKLFIWFTKL